MKNKLFVFFVVILFNNIVFSQTIKLFGTVKDSLQNPMPYANVIAKPKDISKNLKFVITDNEGYYSLQLQKGDTITINITYLGYKKIVYTFVAQKSVRKDFVLYSSNESLDEIVIEMPVTVRGDTTIYKTDKFTNGTERKLKNILKKLPGFKVDKNGKVTVQGEKVTTLLVDGKKFFGGNTKLGVNNIPANAVDKIEVIDNYNEIAFLKGLTDSNKKALNIKLKEDKKNFVFGDIEVGKGNKDFYRTHANTFYYSPKTNVNFIGNLNNTGEKVFTFSDYLSFQGGVNAIFSGNFNWKGGGFSQFLENKDLLRSRNQFGALNITQAATGKLDISGYAIFSKTANESFSETQNSYTNFTEEKENNTHQNNVLGIAKFNLDYTPNKSEQWYFRTQLKRTTNTKDNRILSVINNNQNLITTNKNGIATYINQNIEWHKKQSENHTFSTLVDYTFDKNNPTTFWNTTNPILQGLIPVIIGQNNYKINQLKETNRNHLNTTFKHFWVLNNFNHIYATIGNEYTKEQFVTKSNQVLDNGAINEFVNFNNDLNFRLNDFFIGVHYKFRTGIFTFKQGVYAHQYLWKVQQQNSVRKNKWLVLPDFLVKIKFNNSKKIQLNYNLKTNFSNASQFANQLYLRSYNSVFKGNENLSNQLYHTASARYSRFSLYRGLMVIAGVNYSKRVKGVASVIQQNQLGYFLSPEMIDNPRENTFLNGVLHKTIKKIKYKFEGNATFSNFLQKEGANYVRNKNTNYTYEVGLETLFENFPTFDIGIRNTLGKYTASTGTSTFTTTEPFLNIDYNFLKGFVFNFEYIQYNYRNKSQGTKNTYQVANFILSYKNDDSAWSYKITGNNLFDTKLKQSNSFSSYLISDQKTYVLPRVVMFSIGYNL